MRTLARITTSLFALSLLVSACQGPPPPPTATPTPSSTPTASPTSTPLPPTDTPVPPTDTPAPPTEPPAPPPPPADPQRIEFESEDGTPLVGTFYAASIWNAPVVVLMHQAGTSKEDWEDLALWMQNRSDEHGLRSGYTWFPPLPDSIGSLAVFAFDFRGHGESGLLPGARRFDPLGLLADARAAIALAKTLPGVDPMRVLTGGASIGADAAVDACIELDGLTILEEQPGKGCLGALSLSPGGFLDVAYPPAVAAMLRTPEEPVVYCLIAEEDFPESCKGVSPHDRYRLVLYPGRDHGIFLLTPDRDPAIGLVILEFLFRALKIQV